jgi:gliding motility-associated-like protein
MARMLVFLLSFVTGATWSQNLVPNPGFETFTSLPNDLGQWNFCPPWSSVNNVTNILWPYATPDFLHTGGFGSALLPNSPFAFAMPHTGDAVMGICPGTALPTLNYREYIAAQLTSPMVIGQTYTVSFWTTNGSSGHIGGSSTDHLGIHFSTSPLTQVDQEPILVIPQLEIPGQPWSSDWIQHTFTIVATAAWTHFTVGVFLPDNLCTRVVQVPTATYPEYLYYFLDDFEIVQVTTPDVVIDGDTLICEGESSVLTASNGATYSWAADPDPSLIIGTGTTLTVSPEVTTTYFVYGDSDTAQITVNVTSLPQVAVTSATVCTNEPAALSVSGADSYVWTPVTGLNTTTGPDVVVTTAVSTVYTVIGTSNGCSDTAQSTVTILPAPVITVNDFEICLGGTAVLEATGAATYTWSPDVTFFLPDGSKVTTSPPVTTAYTVTGTDAAGTCSGTAQATVELIDHVDVSILTSANPVLAEYPLVSFSGAPSDEQLIWYFGNGDSTEGAITQYLFPEGIEATYPVMLIVHTAGGCIDTAYVQIVVENGGTYYVPNAFTPDGNQFNNVFKPVFSSGFDAAGYTLTIYNRWGEVVFATTDITDGWDGACRNQKCPDGVYTWKIAAGKLKNAEVVEINGSVTLLK